MDLINDSDKALLAERYSDLKFIDDISNFACVRCGRVAITHYFSNCDHIFCKNCKDIVGKEANHKWSCLRCTTPINEITKQVVDVAIKIYGLRTHCPNEKYGCKETATIFGIPGHLQKCKETRESNLPALLTEESQINTVVRHLEKLTERINQLENNQQQMEISLNNTLHQVKTIEDGVQQRNEKDLEMSQQFQELKMSLEAMKINQEPMSPVKSFRNEAQLTWVINNPSKYVTAAKSSCVSTAKSICSPPIKMIDSPLQITAQIHFYSSIRMEFLVKDLMKPDVYTVSTGLPPLRITLRWCDQSENEPKKDIHRILEYTQLQTPRVPASVQFESLVLSPPYMVNDKIVIQITVDMPHLVEKPFSTTGILVWPVDDLENKKRMLKEGLVDYYYSPHFYTSELGFRVKIGLRITDFTIYVEFMILIGEYDVILKEDFDRRFKVNFTIFNYISEEISVTKTFSELQVSGEIMLWNKPLDDKNPVYTNNQFVIRVKVEKENQQMPYGTYRIKPNKYLKDTSTARYQTNPWGFNYDNPN